MLPLNFFIQGMQIFFFFGHISQFPCIFLLKVVTVPERIKISNHHFSIEYILLS